MLSRLKAGWNWLPVIVRAIILGFAMNILAALTFWVTIYLPAADFYPNQEHFENVVHAYTQLIIAGLAGFIVGQTILVGRVLRESSDRTLPASFRPLLGSMQSLRGFRAGTAIGEPRGAVPASEGAGG